MHRILIPVFLLLLAVAGAMLDFSLAAKARAGGPYSAMDHVNTRFEAVRGLFGADALDALLPPVPQGWTARAGNVADSFYIAGRDATQGELDSLAAIDGATLQAVKGHKTVWRTYQNGAAMITLSISFVPASALRSEPAHQARLVYALMARGRGPALDVPGLALSAVTTDGMGEGTFYFGQIDDQVYVTAASNASRDATLALLRGIGAAGLVALVANDVSDAVIAADADAPVAMKCDTTGAGKFCSVGN